jgi:2-hydroxychromene-2-carboxylate isomerase
MTRSDVQVELFFDVGSPYSYLAATQVAGLEARSGARVRFRPFLLGAVFKESGNDMPARVASKARWMLGDLARWAERYGVPFRMSSHVPVNTLAAQRALTAAEGLFGDDAMQRLAMGLFHAIWAEDRDVSTGDELAFVANAAELDARALAAAISEPAVKDALRRTTQEAVERGAFGAPTFFVGDAMFWGNDRLPLLEDHLRSMQAR